MKIFLKCLWINDWWFCHFEGVVISKPSFPNLFWNINLDCEISCGDSTNVPFFFFKLRNIELIVCDRKPDNTCKYSNETNTKLNCFIFLFELWSVAAILSINFDFRRAFFYSTFCFWATCWWCLSDIFSEINKAFFFTKTFGFPYVKQFFLIIPLFCTFSYRWRMNTTIVISSGEIIWYETPIKKLWNLSRIAFDMNFLFKTFVISGILMIACWRLLT